MLHAHGGSNGAAAAHSVQAACEHWREQWGGGEQCTRGYGVQCTRGWDEHCARGGKQCTRGRACSALATANPPMRMKLADYGRRSSR